MYRLDHTGFINIIVCKNLGINCNTMEKYLLVGWPEIQKYMLHSRWEECVFCCEIEGHPCPDSTYAVPESLYNEVNNE